MTRKRSSPSTGKAASAVAPRQTSVAAMDDLAIVELIVDLAARETTTRR